MRFYFRFRRYWCSAEAVFLLHAQRSEILFPLFFARFLIYAQCRLVVVEIIFAFDRLFIPAILRGQRRPGADHNNERDNRYDDPRFYCHIPTPTQSRTEVALVSHFSPVLGITTQRALPHWANFLKYRPKFALE